MANENALEEALPGYEIGEELGRGAFGVVLAARHRQLGRNVAVKVLSPGLVATDEVRERFHAEAQVLASIDHPHVVPVYDYVELDDACILVMERLGGGTVWQRFVARGFEQRTACAIALVVCSGLDGAHRHGVLHRDMKPENVLFGEDRLLKVGDFGIARVLGEDDALATRGGELLGTPAYMAPEQARGAELGPATDVYAAGVMLYELLSGRLPFAEDGGSMAIVLRHANEDPVPLRDVAPATPTAVADAVMRALGRAPEDRFPSSTAFGEAVAGAASDAWGANWLSASGIDLREPGPILTAAEREPSRAVPIAVTSQAVVRPVIELHSGGGPATDVAITDLLPLRSTPIEMPRPATPRIVASVALALIALIFALVGVGGSSPVPALPRGAVTVAGVDPTVRAVPINLDERIPVIVHGSAADFGTSPTARLVLSIAGVAVVRSTVVPLADHDGTLTGAVDASVGRYIVGGKLTAALQLSGPHGQTDNFAVQVARSPFDTFGGIAGIVLILVVAAYAESLLRTLRLGRRRYKRGAVFGLVVVGALAGIALTMLGWMFELTSPGIVEVVVTAVVGAAAGVFAGLAGLRVGERARVHRRSNRLVLVAKRARPLPAGAVPLGGS